MFRLPYIGSNLTQSQTTQYQKLVINLYACLKHTSEFWRIKWKKYSHLTNNLSALHSYIYNIYKIKQKLFRK